MVALILLSAYASAFTLAALGLGILLLTKPKGCTL